MRNLGASWETRVPIFNPIDKEIRLANFTLERLIFECYFKDAKKKHILNALAFFCFNEQTTQCSPLISQISFATGYHRTTIIRTIGQLEDDGILETIREYHQKNYLINVEKLCMLSSPERLYSPKSKVAESDFSGSGERLYKSQAATTLMNINNKNKGMCVDNLSTTKTEQYQPSEMSELMKIHMAKKQEESDE